LRAARVGGLPYQMHPMLCIPHIPHVLLRLPRTAQSFIDRIILTYISLSPILIYLWPNSAVSISPHILWHRNPISRIHMREVTDLLRPNDCERGLEHQYRRSQFLHLKVREGSGDRMVSRKKSVSLSDRNAQVELRMPAFVLHYPCFPPLVSFFLLHKTGMLL
jgi:hypothetical protein